VDASYFVVHDRQKAEMVKQSERERESERQTHRRGEPGD